jgi:type IV pilus assembly protein PilE
MAAKKVARNPIRISKGFSLLELVVVLALMAVLLTIAVPSYRQYVQRTERAEAIRLMLAIAGCQERTRANTGFYDTTKCLDGLSHNSYSLQIRSTGIPSSPGFTVTAEPNIFEGNDCGTLGLDHTGARSITSENGTLSACWGGR